MYTDKRFIWHLAGAKELPWQTFTEYGGDGLYIYKLALSGYGDGYGQRYSY